MTISPLRAIAEAAEGATLQPRVLPLGPVITASGQVVGFQPGSISQLAQSAGIAAQHLPAFCAGPGHAKADDHPPGRGPQP
jgi:hypothetical protein